MKNALSGSTKVRTLSRVVCCSCLSHEGRAISRGRRSTRSVHSTPKQSPDAEHREDGDMSQAGRSSFPVSRQSPSASSNSTGSIRSDHYVLTEVRNRRPGAKMRRNLSTFSNVDALCPQQVSLQAIDGSSQDMCVCFTVKRLFDGGPVMVGVEKSDV